MIPLYTQKEFEQAKSRDSLNLKCKLCGKSFLATKHKIQDALNPSRKDRADFCSYQCSSISSLPKRIKTMCEQCNALFMEKPSELQRNKHHFCCQSCAAIYHNKHNRCQKLKGLRRSKLEIWIEQQLKLLYPSFEIHYNRTDAIKAELDVYIPFLKLAFELNGVFHYKPIFSSEKLAKTQRNDIRKIQTCYEKGIELCVLDVSHQPNFKPKTSQKFLDIITSIINQAISRQNLP